MLKVMPPPVKVPPEGSPDKTLAASLRQYADLTPVKLTRGFAVT